MFEYFSDDCKLPSFFADVHRHIEFIKCVVVGEKQERDCQIIQDAYDRFVETTKTTTPVDTFNKSCGKKRKDLTLSSTTYDPISHCVVADFPYRIYNSRPWSRIYDGRKADAVIPYQVKINVTNGGWTCGGTIISSSHVLTARHCIENHELGHAIASETYIEAGFYRLEDRTSYPHYQVCHN